jgi:hypothetical protein
VNKERSLDGGNLSIGDLADVEGLYRLEGPILPPNLMMMLNTNPHTEKLNFDTNYMTNGLIRSDKNTHKDDM